MGANFPISGKNDSKNYKISHLVPERGGGTIIIIVL